MDIIKYYPNGVITIHFYEKCIAQQLNADSEHVNRYLTGDNFGKLTSISLICEALWKAIVSHLRKLEEIDSRKYEQMIHEFGTVLYPRTMKNVDKYTVSQNVRIYRYFSYCAD